MLTIAQKNIVFLVATLLFCISCKENKEEQTTEIITSNYIETEIPVYNFNDLEPLLYTNKDKIYIVNFWAMWCAPCVKELPYLQQLQAKNPDIEILLVSLDFPKDIDTKLKPFLKERNIISKVVLLDDPDANSWIDKINPEWSGAIPFTIIFNNETRKFYERSFENLEDIENEISKNFKQ